MPLVIGLHKGSHFYVGSEKFIVEEIHSRDQLTLLRVADGRRTTILSTRGSEILPGVTVALGLHSNETVARLVIDAPPNVILHRGGKHQLNGHSKRKGQ